MQTSTVNQSMRMRLEIWVSRMIQARHPSVSVRRRSFSYRLLILCIFLVIFSTSALVLSAIPSALAASTLSITPVTWNVIGLDSNSPTVGPFRFPIGARVCNTSGAATTVTVNYVWDDGRNAYTGDSYINLRAGSLMSTTLSFSGNSCQDAFFEVEVTQSSAAYDKTRRYHITATDTSGTVSTPVPRELYVEHLISQNRNGITDIKLDGVSIAVGGTMALMVGKTYTIELDGFTATQGYNQLESFINFPNTIFQVLAVTTTYSANNSPYVSGPAPASDDKLYADACQWDNDPGSPNYRSCIGGDYKAGGTVVVKYVVKILSGAGTSQTLTTLLYDFSGSSYHYNSDYKTGVRTAVIIDSSMVSIQKTFTPKAITTNSTSVMAIKLTNPTAENVTGVNVTDTLKSGLVVSSTVGLSYTGCGSNPSPSSLTGGDTALAFSNITISANSTCSINLNVTAASGGTYPNSTGNLFIYGTTNTGNQGSDTLTVSSSNSMCTPGITLAEWTVPLASTNPPDKSSPVAGSPTNVASNVGNPQATGAGGTFSINTALMGVSAWDGYKFTGTARDTSKYFEFALDTTNYRDMVWSFNAARSLAGPTNYDLYYTPNGGVETLLSSAVALASEDTWYTTTQTVASGYLAAGTTLFRIYPYNASNAGSDGDIVLKNIKVTGCGALSPAPTLGKAFSPSVIPTSTFSTLTFTIANTQTNNITLTNVIFNDALPTGIQVANPPVASTTGAGCTGVTFNPSASATTLYYTATQMIPNATCTAQVNVRATQAGQFNNASGFVSAAASGANQTTSGYGAASLTAVAPPSLQKSFAPTSIFAESSSTPPFTSTLTFKITNPNLSSSLSGIVFTDTLPAGLSVMDNSIGNVCGIGSNLTINNNVLAFTGGSLSYADPSCTSSVVITGTGTALGTITNTTTDINSAEGGTGNSATALIDVRAPTPLIGLNKQVSTDGTSWYKYIPIVPTQNVYYKFTVSNEGESRLDAITLADSIYNLGTCSPAIPTSLLAGESASCVIGPLSTALIPSPNPFVNTATVTTTTYPSPITSTAKYGTVSVSLTKNVAETYFTALADTLHYTYTVTNSGGYPLQGSVSVTDTKTSVTCPSVNTVGNQNNYLDPGESLFCTSTYTIVDLDITNKSVTNSAYATVGGILSNTDAKTVNLAADLYLLKSNNVSGSILLSNSFTWTLTIANVSSAGTATFTNTQTVLVDDLPPTGANYALGAVTSTSGISGTLSCVIPKLLNGPMLFSASRGPASTSSTLTCTANGAVTIPPGESFSVSVIVTPTTSGSLMNPSGGICRVDPDQVVPDINRANNDAWNMVDVTALSDVAVSKTDGLTTVIPGQAITYTMVVTNTGPSSVVGAIISDTMSSKLTSPMWTCAASTGSSCSTPSGSGTISTTVDLLASNGTATLTITATVSASATGTLTNTATITVPVGTIDPNPSNNSATDVNTIVLQPALTISKSSNVSTVLAGSAITYTVRYTNTGGGDATNVIITDTVPISTTFAGPSGTWNCTTCIVEGSVYTYSVGTLNAGTSGSVQFVVVVANPLPSNITQVVNTAVIADGNLHTATSSRTVSISLLTSSNVFLPFIVRAPASPTPTPTRIPLALVDPKGMVSDAARDRLWLVNHGNGTVTVFQETTIANYNPTVLRQVTVGIKPFGIGMVDDKIYVANNGGSSPSTVSVVGAGTMTKQTDIQLNTCGTGATHLAINPTTHRVYVSLYGSARVAVINSLTDTLVDCVAVNSGTFGIAAHPASNSIFVGNRDGLDLWRIDGNTNTATQVVNWSNGNGGGSPYYVGINPTTNLLFAMVGLPSSDVPNQLYVYTIDNAGNLGAPSIATTSNTDDGGFVIQSQCSGMIYVAETANNSVRILHGDLSLNSIITLASGLIDRGSFGLLENPTLKRVYISNKQSNTLSMLTECAGLTSGRVVSNVTATPTLKPTQVGSATPSRTLTVAPSTVTPSRTPTATKPVATSTVAPSTVTPSRTPTATLPARTSTPIAPSRTPTATSAAIKGVTP